MSVKENMNQLSYCNLGLSNWESSSTSPKILGTDCAGSVIQVKTSSR